MGCHTYPFLRGLGQGTGQAGVGPWGQCPASLVLSLETWLSPRMQNAGAGMEKEDPGGHRLVFGSRLRPQSVV